MTDKFGEFRYPRQMLQKQQYDGHLSIHDDSMASDLGFSGAPIEGPTHFSQFVPLLHDLFGDIWFTCGCISAHYKNMVVEGEEVRAFLKSGGEASNTIKIGAEKRDGTQVLVGTASVGPKHGETEIATRIKQLVPSKQLVILSDLSVGQKGAGDPERVCMDFNNILGQMYPFSLEEKLKVITEKHPYYTENTNPWGRPIIPLEMISVLTQYSSTKAKFKTKGPAVGLFAGQEIKLIKGPLFVGQEYDLRRKIIALSESRRTESLWMETSIFEKDSDSLCAKVILNSATLKDSYANYSTEAMELAKQ